MKKCQLLLAVFSFLYLAGLPAQNMDSTSQSIHEKTYRVIPWMSGGIAAVGLATNIVGIPKVKDKPTLTEQELEDLVAKGVSKFNASGLRQDVDFREKAHTISDGFMYSCGIMPFLLFVDKKTKGQYWDIALMYLETQAITSNMYTYSPLGPTFIDRYRPQAYYEELSFDERTSGNQRNSFYSGHVATTATGTFFTAKVLCDLHPEWKGEKYLVYGLASLPTAIVAVLRVQALKHFPTDVIAGGVIGAGLGILIPALHKRWQNKVKLSASYTSTFKGGSIILEF
ncbi:MAG: phosphatase PAP2 family protein [Chitinophagales bacterium]|nr:phosphatase PAP2 family protein [Chitinophagales bacterium]